VGPLCDGGRLSSSFVERSLRDARDAYFADLGSGTGRLVAQAWLELPGLQQSLGVELAPSRHAAAMRAWRRVEQSGSDALSLARAHRHGGTGSGEAPEFRAASLLETDLSAVTHAYVASVCMGDELTSAIWSKLRSSAPRLRTVATLRPFRLEDAAEALSHVACAEMTWDAEESGETDVYVYELGDVTSV
jgi:hypothetical protein